MVEWTAEERKIILDIFKNLDYDDIGPKALGRCLVVYPWCKRHFPTFGSLDTPAEIMANKKVAEHGIKVLHGLDRAVKNMDSIKAEYAKLSQLHSEKLHVDPDNFRLLSDCTTIVIAAKIGDKFTPTVQAAFQKFLSAVVSALGRQYH